MRFPRKSIRKVKFDPLEYSKKISLSKQLKRAGGVFAYIPKYAKGQEFAQLSPRTLPNGVQNGLYLQKVSGDVVLNGAMVYPTHWHRG